MSDRTLPVITRDPVVLAAYHQAADAHQETLDKAITAAKALGAEGLNVWTSFWGDTHVVGLIPTPGKEPPAGWFLRKKDRLWRPVRKTTTSPAAVADAHQWMRAHRVGPRPSYALKQYGMQAVTQGPRDHEGTRMWGAAKITLTEDALIVDPHLGAWFEGDPDPTYWTPIRRSQLEALLEATEDAAA